MNKKCNKGLDVYLKLFDSMFFSIHYIVTHLMGKRLVYSSDINLILKTTLLVVHR